VSGSALARPVGWIGTGRMGAALVERLLAAGCDVAVWNRTREKAAPLAERGATIVDSPADLADRDIVVTMVSSSDVLADVVLGERGLLTRPGTAPSLLSDSSTVSMEVSSRVRMEAAKVGTTLLAAPVSGNPKVVQVGRLGVVVSGPREAFDEARPYLEQFGQIVTYVGEEDRARLVKICHNLFLGIVAQGLAETTVLAEAGGVARADYLDFINGSVMGSTFSRYKTPAFVNLDWEPMFTSTLLRKDFELGLEAAREHDVTLPVSALVHQLVVSLMGHGWAEQDFARLLQLMADAAGVDLVPDDRAVSDGLGD
jgi:3-hydroxyisobutyrate dehydrogenase